MNVEVKLYVSLVILSKLFLEKTMISEDVK